MIHFLEDHFENDEEEARKARLKYLGYELSPTGDRLVDKWERQVAKGEIPDLEEDEPLNAKIRDAKIRAAAERFYNLTGERVYIAPKPDSIAMMSGQQESAIPGCVRGWASHRPRRWFPTDRWRRATNRGF